MTQTDRPNVIVFLTDQQRWDSTGLHGNPLDLTPNLDRVARQGTHVANSFTCQPVCGPARSALQTGLYPTTQGVFATESPCRQVSKPWPTASTRGLPNRVHRQMAPGGRGASPGRASAADTRSWLASNVLEFTSEPYRLTMFDDDERGR